MLAMKDFEKEFSSIKLLDSITHFFGRDSCLKILCAYQMMLPWKTRRAVIRYSESFSTQLLIFGEMVSSEDNSI